MNFRMNRRTPALPASLLLTVLLAFCADAVAIPHIPADGKQVVERLPGRTDPAQRELLRLRTALAASPTDLAAAARLARRYIEQARTDGDPRYLGYAQAALQPWWNAPAPPDEALVLRATLRQSTHQFALALQDLDIVVRRDSDNVQAWLTRATVQLVTGDHAGARASCMRLHSRASALVIETCLANIASVTGQASASYARLKGALAAAASADPAIRRWVETLLAEMAERAGQDAEAEAYYRKALAEPAPDSYLLGAWCDFLLERGRAPEVIKLLKDSTRVDALLLRYALALKAVGAPAAQAQTAVLARRFDAAMLRGDTVHQREQARFELALRGDAAQATRLALLNWAVQKEPADLRILADSAAASGDRQAARTVTEWVARTGIEERAVTALLPALRGRP
jgi:Tfp pilus assembly protein PilF